MKLYFQTHLQNSITEGNLQITCRHGCCKTILQLRLVGRLRFVSGGKAYTSNKVVKQPTTNKVSDKRGETLLIKYFGSVQLSKDTLQICLEMDKLTQKIFTRSERKKFTS